LNSEQYGDAVEFEQRRDRDHKQNLKSEEGSTSNQDADGNRDSQATGTGVLPDQRFEPISQPMNER